MYEFHSHFHRITATGIQTVERIHKLVDHGASIAEVIRFSVLAFKPEVVQAFFPQLHK